MNFPSFMSGQPDTLEQVAAADLAAAEQEIAATSALVGRVGE